MNVHGPRSLRSSEGVIPSFIRRIKAGRPLTIYGRGDQSRDFVHVSDVVESIVLATRTKACRSDVFNVGTGIPTTIEGLVGLLRKLLSKDLRVRHLPARKGDVKMSYANVDKAARVLGFKPKVRVQDGVADLLKREELTTLRDS